MPKVVVILGSAPDAVAAKDWSKGASQIVAINNAWKIRSDWDYLIYPEDFPPENAPTSVGPRQTVVTAADYVPIQNDYGGFVYAGGTMAFTAAYWALGALKPDVLAFVGCDMVYPVDGSQTHFYGQGLADPLRDDVTLQSLEAKANRLHVSALKGGCVCLNLSEGEQSRLTFPRATLAGIFALTDEQLQQKRADLKTCFDILKVGVARQAERRFNYFIESGRYWEHLDQLSKQDLAEVDDYWLQCLPQSTATGL